MSASFARIFFFCLILLPFSKLPFAFSEDKVPACRVCYKEAKARVLLELDRLEGLYAHYRYVEQKIRLMTYEHLWQSRQDRQDPLSKEVRAEGEEEESRLLEILKDLDKESAAASTGLWEGLKNFPEQEKNLKPCCAEKHYEDCLSSSLKPVLRAIETGLPKFDHVFEHEREYRKEVDLTAAGREGLYPEDALEDKVKHGDFFPRYEMERRAQRFEDDREMVRFFQSIRKMLTARFAGDDCCYACGKTDWEVKTEKMFRES